MPVRSATCDIDGVRNQTCYHVVSFNEQQKSKSDIDRRRVECDTRRSNVATALGTPPRKPQSISSPGNDPGIAALAPSVVSRTALGLGGATAPSDRITLGFIGIGCMGQGHLADLLTFPDVQVLAVCDVDTWRRENAQRAVDDAYAGRRTAGGHPGCAAYVDFLDVLARDDIDAVVISLGDRWHSVATVMAAEAGKDIYVEKPVSLKIAEARAMVQAVRRHGRICQVGLQQRSAPEFQLATQLVRDGGARAHPADLHDPQQRQQRRGFAVGANTRDARLGPLDRPVTLAPVQSPSALPGQSTQRRAVGIRA